MQWVAKKKVSKEERTGAKRKADRGIKTFSFKKIKSMLKGF